MFYKKKYSFKFTLASIFFSFIALGLNHAVAAVGGGSASSVQSRGIVGISFDNTFSNCVGVILEPTKILTTVSCIEPFGTRVTAANIRVHPFNGTEIGGSSFFPVLNEDVTPIVGVSEIALHPQNTFSGGAHNIAVLTLTAPLSNAPVTLYDGTDDFSGESGEGFGWEEFEKQGPFSLTTRFYRASIISFPKIIDGDSDSASIASGCYDSFTDTETVFCAGFKNATRHMESIDVGAPMFRTINDETLVIGLLNSASGGFEIGGEFQYERYSRISTLKEFILAEAPNAQFVNPGPQAPNPGSQGALVPVMNLLLSD